MAEETVLDAINEALGVESETPPADETPPEGAEDEGADDAGAEDEGADDEGDGEGEGDEEGDGEGEGDGRERNADGTFKPRAGEKPGETGEKKAGEKPGERKEPDPINDPIPKDLKQETRDRMVSLVKTAKELTAARDEVQGQMNTIVGGLQAAGVTPEQYSETLSWLALFNSRDPAQQGQALDILVNMTERLATLLGREVNLSDPLKGHPDLQQALQQNKITKELALEMARTRNQGKFRGEIETHNQNAENQRAASERELAQARKDLTELGNTLKASDPQYAQKRAALVPILQPIFQTLPPSQWKAKFQEAYRNFKVPAVARRPSVPANQPMRARGNGSAGGGSGGSMQGQPKSALDAVNSALAELGV